MKKESLAVLLAGCRALGTSHGTVGVREPSQSLIIHHHPLVHGGMWSRWSISISAAVRYKPRQQRLAQGAADRASH